jgi:RND family efflux transporter MFP subunit
MFWTSLLRRTGLALGCLLPLAAPAAELPFGTAVADYREVTREHVFDATIEAVKQSTVSAQTSGQVLEVYFDVDDYVPQGGVLLRLKDTQHRARLDQAEANLEEARARFKEAKDEFERYQELFKDDHISKSEMDRAQADLNAARARLESAEAAVEQAEEQLDYTVVKAPYSGIVVERHVEPGETVNVGSPLMTGFSLEHLRAITVVPQNLIGPVREQAQARILIPAEDRMLLAEKLTFTPYADPLTHTFTVRVDLPRGEIGIYPGSFVKVAFVTGRERALMVPRDAVAYRSEVRGVYVVEGEGRVDFRQVRLGETREDSIQILAGLEPGEEVALDPVRAAAWLKSEQEAGEAS